MIKKQQLIKLILLRKTEVVFLSGLLFILLFWAICASVIEVTTDDVLVDERFLKIKTLPNSSTEYLGIDSRGNIHYVDVARKEEDIIFMYDDITDNMIKYLRENKQ